MLTLTLDELHELIQYRQAAKQRAWLDERRIAYRVEGTHLRQRILVSRAAAERWLSGVEVPTVKGPNLSLVN